MIEAWRNAAVLGGIAGGIGLVARLPRAARWLPALTLAGVGAALFLQALAPEWAVSSLLDDAPWGAAVVLALWSAHARSGWVRARSWPAVVILAALFGDVFVAVGLAAVEQDPERRARLVLAASGASLIGVTSGAAPLLLGWGGPEAVGMGLLLAAVGFAGGSGRVEPQRPDLRAAGVALVVPLFGAVVAWLAILGGALEVLAIGLEQLPLLPYRHGELLAFGGATVASALGDEGTFALMGRETLLRALSLRGDLVPTALRAGLAVGGGLPLLLATRSRLRVGLPLWLLQIALVTTWLYLR